MTNLKIYSAFSAAVIRTALLVAAVAALAGCNMKDDIFDPLYTVTVANDGNGTAAANHVKAAEEKMITLSAAAATDYQFKQWVVTEGDITLSSATTSPATFAMPAEDVAVRAEFELTVVAKKALADAEMAKVTGFQQGANTTASIVLDPIVSAARNPATVMNLVSVKAGADAGSAVALTGATMAPNGVLSLPAQALVDAVDLTYVEVTFTATLNGVTSDERTIDISSFFGVTSTIGKLKTDKAKMTGMAYKSGTTSSNLSPLATLSTGVSIPAVTDNGAGTSDGHGAVSAAAGSSVRMDYTTAPSPQVGDNTITFENVTLQCDGTAYIIPTFIISVQFPI